MEKVTTLSNCFVLNAITLLNGKPSLHIVVRVAVHVCGADCKQNVILRDRHEAWSPYVTNAEILKVRATNICLRLLRFIWRTGF